MNLTHTSLAESMVETNRTCTHPGCERALHAKGFCRMHYDRSRLGQDMNAPAYGYTPWGQAIDAALGLADAHGTDEWGRALERFRGSIDRIVACGYEGIKRGWKKRHRRSGHRLLVLATAPRCTVPGCSRAHRAKGLCNLHYMQARAQARNAA